MRREKNRGQGCVHVHVWKRDREEVTWEDGRKTWERHPFLQCFRRLFATEWSGGGEIRHNSPPKSVASWVSARILDCLSHFLHLMRVTERGRGFAFSLTEHAQTQKGPIIDHPLFIASWSSKKNMLLRGSRKKSLGRQRRWRSWRILPPSNWSHRGEWRRCERHEALGWALLNFCGQTLPWIVAP